MNSGNPRRLSQKRAAWVILAAVVTVFSSPLYAQTSLTGFLGFPTFVPQAGGQWDSVNLVNLNVHVRIPITARKGRGPAYSYAQNYDNAIFTQELGHWVVNFGWDAAFGSVPFGLPVGSVHLSATQQITCPNGSGGTQNTFDGYIDTLRTFHPFAVNIVTNSCNGSGGTSTTKDGSGYTVMINGPNDPGTVISSDGTAVFLGGGTPSSPQTITDSNGNQLTFDGTTIKDTLGTTPATSSTTGTSFSYSFPNFQTGSRTITFSLMNPAATLQTAFHCNNIGDVPSGAPISISLLVDTITLPDGVSTFKFTYEPTPGTPSNTTGRLASVKLPTGATISYAYSGANNGINCNDGMPMNLTRTTSDGTWSYSRTLAADGFTTLYTTITDPQKNQTVVYFASGIETERQIYQGSNTGGTLLQTVFTCYNGSKPNCNNTTVTLPVTEVSRFVQLPGGLENEQDVFLDSSGDATEIDEYDFASSPPTALLRKTVVTYASNLGNILNRPASVTVCSPGGSDSACNGATNGGTKIAQTTFGYDESTPTPTSGITQHVAVTGSRGNMTSIHRWLNTDNSTPTTKNVFDDTGNVVSTTDPGNHTTLVTFGGCNGAFPTQTSLPDTNSPNLAHHRTSAAYDCGTGLLTSSTDQNANTTTYHYNDSLLRLTEVDFADQGKTTYSYPDQNHTTVQGKIDSSRFTSTTTVLDGYGRISRTATANGESTPYDQQDTCYDSNGRVAFRSYPYQGNAPNSAATCPNTSLNGDTFGPYDAMGRLTKTTHSDGTFSTTSYAGRATQVTDEGNGTSNVSRILQQDGLGRLASVCELYSSSGPPLLGDGKTPASCGLDITGSGFLTAYTYDLRDNLKGVTQGALTARSYSYDSLSRLTSETTPEAGAVNYTYDPDSLLKTRARPAANQPSASILWTTTYAYDELHRLRNKTYTSSDPTNNPVNTPVPTFNYDETSVWSKSLTNTVGRLTSESAGSPLIAEQVFSYDPMGRPATNLECTPNTCNASPFAPYSLGYQYDFLGDVTSAGNGVGVTFTNSYNIAGRLTGMTSSLSDANHPASLINNAHYGAFGIASDTLGNTVTESVGYTTRAQLNSYTAQNPAVPATGSIVISGSERSTQVLQQAATPGQGSVTINGSLQSKQVQTQAATYASASVTISHGNTMVTFDTTCISQPDGITYDCSETDPDTGGIYLTIGAYSAVAGYNFSSGDVSDAILAANLASAINQSSAPPVHATSSGNTLILTSNTIGPAGNFSASIEADSGWCGTGIYGTCVGVALEFGFGPSNNNPYSFNLSGGQNAVYTTVYDSGSCTITANNHGDSKSWSGSGTTAGAIAAGLQSNITNDNSSYVNATVSNNAVSLTSKLSGAATNYPLTSSCTYDSGNFSGPSFTTSNSGSTLTGGTDAGYRTVFDTGTATVTINNSPSFSKTVGYGQTDTPTTVAAALAHALSHNTDSTSPVNASSSGGTVSFTAVTGGTSTDFTFTSSSATNNSNFTGTSFPTSPASGTMTGGTNTTTVYSFSLTPAPDGQITSANDFLNGNLVLGYDPLSRLISTNKNSGQQTFNYVYDRYANRWQQNAPQGGPGPNYLFDDNNHLNGSGVTYDALGEVLTDGLGNTFTWDAEGRLIKVNQGITVVATYSYDAAGRRVHGPQGEYVYDLAGTMITQMGLSGGWNLGEIYAGGRHLATYSNSTTYFYHGDWLGTKRVMTGMNGAAAVTCTGFPFGDGVSCTGTNPSNNYFTDDIHDGETNLEHTLFRKYSGTQGRWLTPDPAGMGSADPTNPQSWNRYAYVMNDPVNQTDALGLDPGSGDIGGYGLCGLGGCVFSPGGFGPCMGFGAGQGMGCGGSPYDNCYSVDCGGFPNFPALGIGGPIPIAPLSGFGPGEFQIPLRSLSQTIQDLLAGLPWNNPCIMSPISDGCGATAFPSLPVPWVSLPTDTFNVLAKGIQDQLCQQGKIQTAFWEPELDIGTVAGVGAMIVPNPYTTAIAGALLLDSVENKYVGPWKVRRFCSPAEQKPKASE